MAPPTITPHVLEENANGFITEKSSASTPNNRKPSGYEQSPQVVRKKQQRAACVGGFTMLILTAFVFSAIVSGIIPSPLEHVKQHVSSSPVAKFIARRGLKDMMDSTSTTYSRWVDSSALSATSHQGPSHFTDESADFYDEGDVGALIAGLSKSLGRPVDSMKKRTLRWERERDEVETLNTLVLDVGRWYLMGKPTKSDPSPGSEVGDFEKSFLYTASEDIVAPSFLGDAQES